MDLSEATALGVDYLRGWLVVEHVAITVRVVKASCTDVGTQITVGILVRDELTACACVVD